MCIRDSNIGGNRNIVHIADAQQVHLVGFTGLGSDGVAEEQQQDVYKRQEEYRTFIEGDYHAA